MKKSELINQLNAINGDPEVCVFDWRKNLAHDDGDGTGVGVEPNFKIEMMSQDDVTDDSKPFIALSFENDDYDDNGELVLF